ncbi:unnamed protein product, partial [Ectocarpus sp. 12 AP-2014]
GPDGLGVLVHATTLSSVHKDGRCGLRKLFRGNDEYYQVPERRCKNGVGPRRLRQQH